jgi:hypothetical protein
MDEAAQIIARLGHTAADRPAHLRALLSEPLPSETCWLMSTTYCPPGGKACVV